MLIDKCCKERSRKNIKNLLTQKQHMWNVKVIPIITGATESLLQIFQEYLKGILGKYSNNEKQNMAILGKELILRKILT